ncbi:MAG: SH3 domain-containing protein [Verrucomicrobiales bacterium]|nr:SH3 domain-containing protein [Verrucomicrobiales bacterium]
MNRLARLGWLWGILLLVFPEARAQSPTVVKADRVNVRSRPSLQAGEVVTQLVAGQRVIVFEEGLPAPSPKSPVSDWARIELPAGTPVWASAAHVARTTGIVQARRLNLRAGPSEDFGVLGTVPEGTVLVIRKEADGWIEVEAPLGLSGYVAGRFLDPVIETAPLVPLQPAATPPPPPAVVVPQPEPIPEPEPSTAAPEPTAPPSPPTVETVPAAPASEVPAAPIVAVTEPFPIEPFGDTPVRRVIRREGIVRPTLSIQAPTDFELRAADTGRLLNYLLPASAGINVRVFRGQRVLVVGEEYIESRWPLTPLIIVEGIKLAP